MCGWDCGFTHRDIVNCTIFLLTVEQNKDDSDLERKLFFPLFS